MWGINATYDQTDDVSVTTLVLNEFARFSVKDKSETLSSTLCTFVHIKGRYKVNNIFDNCNTRWDIAMEQFMKLGA